jgi:hypothetical protein
MDFYTLLDQVIALLRQRQRVTYRAFQRLLQLDDASLEDVKAALMQGQRLAVDEEGAVLVWVGDVGPAPPALSGAATPQARAPLTYTPAYLAEKILTSRSLLEGERKQVTVLFADLKGSVELLAERAPWLSMKANVSQSEHKGEPYGWYHGHHAAWCRGCPRIIGD